MGMLRIALKHVLRISRRTSYIRATYGYRNLLVTLDGLFGTPYVCRR